MYTSVKITVYTVISILPLINLQLMIVTKVSQRGSRRNERSIRYREDLDVSDVTDYLSIPGQF